VPFRLPGNIISSPFLEFLHRDDHLLVPSPTSIQAIEQNPPLFDRFHDAGTTATADVPTPARARTTTDLIPKPRPNSKSATATAAAAGVLSISSYIETQQFLQSTTRATCASAWRRSRLPDPHINDAAAFVRERTATAFTESRYTCSAFTTG
jgi:hypothetical protein